MKPFQAMAVLLSPAIPIRMQGRHGIGKSQSVYQIAKKLGLQVVERRLSQMTEGDLIGLPEMTGEGKTRSTSFKPCDWLIDCCENPRVLFLDELNRALPGVGQATFQLADSRGFYGYKLHPETRIFVGENIGDQYQVQTTDPAEISRYAIVELDPSIEEWIEYLGEINCHSATIEFLRGNSKFIEHRQGAFENNKKYPDRRAWVRLDTELQQSKVIDDPYHEVFYHICMAMVGVEAAVVFTKFCKEREQQITAKDIIANWKKAKKKMGKETQEKYVECIGKLTDHIKVNDVNDDEAKQIASFMEDAPAECRLATWASLSNNNKNLIKIHPLVKDLMVRTARIDYEKIEEERAKREAQASAEKEKSTEKTEPEAKTTTSTKKKKTT